MTSLTSRYDQQPDFFQNTKKSPIRNYHFVSVIGKGAFGKVILARSKINEQYYAIKIMKKKRIIEMGFTCNILAQKTIMSNIDHPFMIQLKQSFQDNEKLYLIMQYCPGGDFLTLLQRVGKLTQEHAKFYATQIVLVMDHLHQNKIIYRDLKPENILLDEKGYLKIVDFGLSKALYNEEEKALSICGTPEYFAPEMIKRAGHDQSIDWWCLGCLIYQMVVGRPPFSHKNRLYLFQKILYDHVHLPTNISPQLRDLLLGLLKKTPQDRLGYKGSDKIKFHKWFSGLNQKLLTQKLIKAPFIPVVQNGSDVTNFAEQFTNCSFQSDKQLNEYENSLQHDDFLGFDFQHENQHQTPSIQD